MPPEARGGSAGGPGSIKVNETLNLGLPPGPARVRLHFTRAAVAYAAAPSARDVGGEGRDRGVNSAPVVLQQAAKGGLLPSLCFSLVFFSCDVSAPSRACRSESRGLFRRDASGADLTFATCEAAGS
jgi:hypothetical protein